MDPSALNITGWHTQQELLGFPCIDFAYTMPPKQQICVSRSFAKEIRDYNQLAEQISLFTAMVCEKLRKQKSVCHQVLVFLLTDRFKPNNIHPFESRMVTLPVATDSSWSLIQSTQMPVILLHKG
jgi:DNA polymerase V